MLKSKTPLVLAFGWWGSKDYNMKSFEKIYASAGYEFKYMIQSTKSFLDIKLDNDKIQEMYEAAKNRNILLHLFSINGAFSFLNSMMMNDYKDYKPNLNIKGIIWDLLPGKYQVGQVYHPFSRDFIKYSQSSPLCTSKNH